MLLSYISRQDGLTLATQGYTKDPVFQSADSESKWSRTQGDPNNENRNLSASSTGPLVPHCSPSLSTVVAYSRSPSHI